jgi:hypothetical protein
MQRPYTSSGSRQRWRWSANASNERKDILFTIGNALPDKLTATPPRRSPLKAPTRWVLCSEFT